MKHLGSFKDVLIPHRKLYNVLGWRYFHSKQFLKPAQYQQGT